MGCCQAQNTHEVTESNFHIDVSYAHTADLKIKELKRDGSVESEEAVHCSLTSPTTFECRRLTVGAQTYAVSTCVLPGLDPRGNYLKECQDGIFVGQSAAGVLLVLMDGHGNDGLKVVKACLKKIEQYFKENSEAFEQEPQTAIESMLLGCDQLVKADPELDCSLSGSTAVAAYLNASGLHVGSVGDSRAVLGMLAGRSGQPTAPPCKNAHFRQITPPHPVEAVQLSVDQKPNHVGEMDRILKAGGRVSKITDQYGKQVGPYRAWQKFGSLPGLAMSRSIGDKMGSEIGVIATPVFNDFGLYTGCDLFIVLASDGVW